MSFDVDEIKHLKRCRKEHWLSTFCRTIFGCAAKTSKVEQPAKSYTSIAIQCQVENDLGGTGFFGDNPLLVGSNTKFDITIVENGIYPQTDEFKTSLNKLDKLINTLNEIQGLYKNKGLSCSEFIPEQLPDTEIPVNTENENILKCEGIEKLSNWHSEKDETYTASAEEILNFNINFDKDTFIQCHTSKGKNSLKIIQNPGQKNFNPLILHRCESEFLLTRHTENITSKSKVKNRKSSTEISSKEMGQLQRSYHTLPGKFGNSIINLSSFKSNLVDHMINIKEDVKTLRSILCSIECLVRNEDRPILPIYFQEIRKWFLEREPDLTYSIHDKGFCRELLKLEDSRYVEARIRAINFCKFYTLGKLTKSKKSKLKKYKKIKT